MSGGAFDKFIAIQSRSTAQDAFGQPADSWTTVIELWARIEPLSGREYLSRSGESAESTHKITSWLVEGVTPAHRVLFGDRVFDVLHAAPLHGRDIELQMICAEHSR